MTEETSHPAEEPNIHERLRALREKASDLSETLDGIEETLQSDDNIELPKVDPDKS